MADYKSNGYQPTTVENVSSNGAYGSTPPKQSKLKAHFRKFWWLHLTSFVLSTILITLLLVYVGLPNIAQGNINKAELFADDQTISEPTPNSVKLKMVSRIINHSIFTPTLDSFQADLFLEDTLPNIKPFGRITLPVTHALKVTHVTIEQPLEILDQEQFAQYNLRVTQSETYRVALRGKTKLHLGALPVVNIDFNKVITMKGLNKLAGFQVTDIKISLTPEKDGTNMQGTVIIQNPAPMHLTLGDVTQNIFVKTPSANSSETPIGTAFIPNLVLSPGENRVPMKSTADQPTVLTLISTKFKDARLPIIAKTASIARNGQRLSYYEFAMSRTPLETTLDLGPAFKLLGIDPAVLAGGKRAA